MLFRLGRAGRVMLAVALAVGFWGLFAAVAPAQTTRPQSTAELAAALKPLQASLASVEVSARYASDDQELAGLAPRLAPLRDELHGEVEALQPRLALIDTRLKQLGPPPAAGAPPEDQALAAERKRLTTERGEVDAALKQANLLILRVDQLSDGINRRRRALLTGQLFARSAGLFDPAFWREIATAAPVEVDALGDLARSSWWAARGKVGTAGLIAVGVVVVAFAVG